MYNAHYSIFLSYKNQYSTVTVITVDIISMDGDWLLPFRVSDIMKYKRSRFLLHIITDYL